MAPRSSNAGSMSELVSLLDLSTTLNSSAPREAVLDAALEIVMRELQVERGALFVRCHDGAFEIRASRGLPPGMPATLAFGAPPNDLTLLGPADEAHVRNGLALLCPIHRRERLIAVLGLGPLPEGRAYGAREHGFLRSVAACAASAIENGLIHDELRRVNQQLTVKVFQLHNLFDISRELAGGFEEEAIQSLVITTYTRGSLNRSWPESRKLRSRRPTDTTRRGSRRQGGFHLELDLKRCLGRWRRACLLGTMARSRNEHERRLRTSI